MIPAAALSLAMESTSLSIADTLVTTPVTCSDVGQSDEVGGDSWPEPELTAQARRLLQIAARFVELAGAMFGDAKVPQGGTASADVRVLRSPDRRRRGRHPREGEGEWCRKWGR